MVELPPKPNVADITIIDEDFREASRYYCNRVFSSGTAETMYQELKRKYEEEESLDDLVFILARHRTRFQGLTLEPEKESNHVR